MNSVSITFYYECFFCFFVFLGNCNLPPVFTQDMNNLALSESTQLGSIVYKLEGFDPEGGEISFGLVGSVNFEVNSQTGDVKIVKELDREVSWICYRRM